MEAAHPEKGLNTANRAVRLATIQDAILQHGSVLVDDLCEQLGVSRMTIHRDLDVLERRGALRKIRGGATAEKSSLFESDVPFRMRTALAQKEAIAAVAAELIEPGQAVMLDESTTSMLVLKNIGESTPVTVITNFMPSIQRTIEMPHGNLIAIGGDYHANYQAFLGIVSERTVSQLYADILFASSSALNGTRLFHQNQAVIGSRQAMMRCAGTKVLLIDSSKIGNSALYEYGTIRDYDHVVVDSGIRETDLEALRETRVQVHVAQI